MKFFILRWDFCFLGLPQPRNGSEVHATLAQVRRQLASTQRSGRSLSPPCSPGASCARVLSPPISSAAPEPEYWRIPGSSRSNNAATACSQQQMSVLDRATRAAPEPDLGRSPGSTRSSNATTAYIPQQLSSWVDRGKIAAPEGWSMEASEPSQSPGPTDSFGGDVPIPDRDPALPCSVFPDLFSLVASPPHLSSVARNRYPPA